jgi:hypothetical protein
VTNHNPNIRIVAPAHRPEELAEALVGALARPASPRLSWGPIKTIGLGLLSGGLLPLVMLPKKFRDFIHAERDHLRHLTEWLRLQYPGADSERLHAAVSSKLRFRMSMWVASLLLAVMAVTWAATDLTKLAQEPVYLLGPFGSVQIGRALRPLEPKFLFDFTARLPSVVKQTASMPRAMIAAQGFALLLIGAHVIAWWQVVAHVRAVRGLVGQYNAFAARLGWEPLEPPRPQTGLNASWIAGIVGLLLLGAWWGAPMMVAAAAQARYIRTSGRALRLALSARVQRLIAERRPAVYVPEPGELRRVCRQSQCPATIPIGADFCPRCGTQTEGA